MCINGDVRLDGELYAPIQHRHIRRLVGLGPLSAGDRLLPVALANRTTARSRLPKPELPVISLEAHRCRTDSTRPLDHLELVLSFQPPMKEERLGPAGADSVDFVDCGYDATLRG